MSKEFVELNGEKKEILNNGLYLDAKGIKDISEIKGLEEATDIRTLWLGGNEITEIHGLESLINLDLLILANNQIKMLNLDNASLKDECKSFREREGRFSSLFELINERTKDKDIPVIHRKLNTIYNGL